MPRKYELVRWENSGEPWRSIPPDLREHFAGKASFYDHVTAIDERDVSPLLEAIRGASARTVDDRTRDELTAALKPFEAEEGSG